MSRIIAKALVSWLLMLLAAIVNAVIRETLIVPEFGMPVGRGISSLTLSVIIFSIVLLIIHWFPFKNRSALWILGTFWTALTIAFEFSFGYLRGLSWEAMLSDYNIIEGKLWVFVLFTTFISPRLAAKLRGRI